MKIKAFSVTFLQFEMFAILAAAKSNHNEKSWYDALTHSQASALSPIEAAQVANLAKKDRFGVFKILLFSRVPAANVEKILSIFNELESGLKSLETWFGRLTFPLFGTSEFKKGQVRYPY